MDALKAEWVIAGVVAGCGIIAVAVPLLWKGYKIAIGELRAVRTELVPDKTDSGVTTSARLWQTIVSINETTGRLAASDAQLVGRVAVNDRDIGDLKRGYGAIVRHVNVHSRRLSNVERMCRMTHRANDESGAAIPVLPDLPEMPEGSEK